MLAARCAGARLLLRQDALLQRILLQLRQRIPRLRPRTPAVRRVSLPDAQASLTYEDDVCPRPAAAAGWQAAQAQLATPCLWSPLRALAAHATYAKDGQAC